MRKTAAAVHEAIDQDIVLQEAIAREIISPKAVAQYLRSQMGIEGRLEAIRKAVERYEVDDRPDSYREAWAILERASLSVVGPVCALEFEKSTEVVEKIPELFDDIDIDKEDILHVIPSERGVTLIIEPEQQAHVVELFGAPHITKRLQDLRLFSVGPTGFPKGSGGALGMLVSGLAGAGVEVPLSASSLSELFIAVSEEDHDEAYAVLTGLISLAESKWADDVD